MALDPAPWVADVVAAAVALLGTVVHLGPAHAFERVLVAVVAIGPFLVLGVVALVVRRRDARERRGSPEQGAERS